MPVDREKYYRLPKWAQAEISRLNYLVHEAERKLDQLKAEYPQTRLWYGDYDNPVYLPDKDTVYWQLEGDRIFDQIQVRLEKDSLEVIGGHSIALEPNSSNFVRIRLRD